jgi:hypothetical protein
MNRRTIRVALLGIGLGSVGLGLIVVATPIFRSSLLIQDMPVYVKYPRVKMELPSLAPGVPPPPPYGSPLVLYPQSTNKPVSELDIKHIKKAIPRSRTIGRLYRPERITVEVEFPTHATAEFWRGRKPFWISLSKTNQKWEVEKVYSARYSFATPPTLWERISEALPF